MTTPEDFVRRAIERESVEKFIEQVYEEPEKQAAYQRELTSAWQKLQAKINATLNTLRECEWPTGYYTINGTGLGEMRDSFLKIDGEEKLGWALNVTHQWSSHVDGDCYPKGMYVLLSSGQLAHVQAQSWSYYSKTTEVRLFAYGEDCLCERHLYDEYNKSRYPYYDTSRSHDGFGDEIFVSAFAAMDTLQEKARQWKLTGSRTNPFKQ